MTDPTPLPDNAFLPDRPAKKSSSGVSRRGFLGGAALGVGVGVGGALATYKAVEATRPPARKEFHQSSIGPEDADNGIPGPYPGKVVEINHPGALLKETKVLPDSTGDKKYTLRNVEVVRQMLARGMKELTGRDNDVEAWRSLFSPGERIGIKVVPVGQPDSISSHELIHEIVAALQSAVGIKPQDVIVFDRYRTGFIQPGYDKNLPAGVEWDSASADYDELQLELDGQMPGKEPADHVSGYDPQVYRELPFCAPEHDQADERRFRSHLCNIVSNKIDKLICLPVLKDHASAGVTLSLKNMSHGLVNNVCRSHIVTNNNRLLRGATLNSCGNFIPSMVSLPPTRKKAVLQILDGLVGTYEGGPGNWNKSFATWQHKSLFFATDPVALDHIGWEIIDAKRAEEGWPGVASMGLSASTGVKEFGGKPFPEQFHIRQPEHIPLAATLGLGVFEREKIKHQRIDLA